MNNLRWWFFHVNITGIVWSSNGIMTIARASRSTEKCFFIKYLTTKDANESNESMRIYMRKLQKVLKSESFNSVKNKRRSTCAPAEEPKSKSKS